jgi:hypothetical protein
MALDMEELIIQEIKRLDIKPGEVLAVRVHDDATREGMNQLKRWFNEKKIHAMIYNEDIEFTVIRKPE